MIDSIQEVRIVEDDDTPVWEGNLQFIPRVGEYWVSKSLNLYKVIEITHRPFEVKIIVNEVHDE